MRLVPCLVLLAISGPALADTAHPPAHRATHGGAPKPIGTYGQWQAATHREGDAVTCFVFTRAEASPQRIPGRGDVVLSVTRRPQSHDVAALSAGFVLSGHEDALLQAGSTKMLFYIAGRSAFARDNAAAIAAFGHEGSVVAKLHGPRGITAIDHFSLKGFASAYAALAKVCPAAPAAAP
jgi:hypothetical protein